MKEMSAWQEVELLEWKRKADALDKLEAWLRKNSVDIFWDQDQSRYRSNWNSRFFGKHLLEAIETLEEE